MDARNGPAQRPAVIRIRHGATIFRVVKYAIYGLLTLNIYLLLRHETLNEAIDSAGWVVLLAVFEYESSSMHDDYASVWEKRALIAAQLVAYGVILHAAITYALTGEWLDLANSVVWLMVCGAITYDVYAPGEYGAAEWRVRNGIKIALYALLVGFAVWWGIEGELLNFYDALLWILCFVLVEMNIISFEDPARPRPAAGTA